MKRLVGLMFDCFVMLVVALSGYGIFTSLEMAARCVRVVDSCEK